MRFRLDPRDARPEADEPRRPLARAESEPAPAARPQPERVQPAATPGAARAPEAVRTPAPAMPRAAPLPAPLAGRQAATQPPNPIQRATDWLRENKRTATIAAVVLVLLTGATVGAMMAFDLGPFAYPDKYLLTKEEMPSGMRLGEVPPEARNEFGLTSNPGKADERKMSDQLGSEDNPPKEVWLEFIQGPSDTIGVFAFRYGSTEDAKLAASDLTPACFFGGGTLLRDGNILVMVIAEGGEKADAQRVVSALVSKTPDLVRVC